MVQHRNVLQDRIVQLQKSHNLPQSAQEFTNRLANEYDMHYTQQYVKRMINVLVDHSKLVMVGKRRKTELYAIPNQTLDAWQSTITHQSPEHPYIKLGDFNFTADVLVDKFSKARWTPFNDPTNEDISARITLLLLGNSVDDLLARHQISRTKDLFTPVEELSNNLRTLADNLDTITSNKSVKDGSSGNYVTDQMRAEALDRIDRWITNYAINLRSVNSGISVG